MPSRHDDSRSHRAGMTPDAATSHHEDCDAEDGQDRAEFPLLPTAGVPGGNADQGDDEYAQGLDLETVKREYYGPKRSAEQWRISLLLMVLEFLQVYSVILILGERFPWPAEWVSNVRILHLFNGDYYEFVRVGCCWAGTTLAIPSADIALNYTGYAVVWTMIPVLGAAILLGVHAYLRRRAAVSMLLNMAFAQRVIFAFGEIVYLPVGIALSRLFQCSGGFLVVDDSAVCWSGKHAAVAGPLLAIGITMLIALPVFVWYRVRLQLIHTSPAHHERHLRQKELEYAQRADTVWSLFGMHLFSPYRRQWAYFKVVSLCFRLSVATIMSFLYQHPKYNTGLLLLLLTAYAVALTAQPPYRLRSFGILHALLSWLNVLSCLLGYLVILRTRSPLLVSAPLRYELMLLFIAGLVLLSIVGVYAVMKSRGVCFKRPLWPSGTRPEFDALRPTQRRSVALVIEGRQLLEAVYRTPAALVPTHDLADLIERVNTTFETALKEYDPYAETLRDLLDELVNAHNTAAPFSMYADSKKKSVSKTAKELQEIMPDFRRRLDRRDYDLVLADPRLKRVLLKLYCARVFLGMRDTSMRRQRYEENMARLAGGGASRVNSSARVDMYMDDADTNGLDAFLKEIDRF